MSIFGLRLKIQNQTIMNKSTQVHRENLDWYYEQSTDIRLELLKNYLELSRILVNQIMEDNVRSMTGERYEHSEDGAKKYYRHGFNPGSIKLKDQRLPIQIPRIRESASGKCVAIPEINKIKAVAEPSNDFLKKIIYGISTRDYKKITEHLVENFGLSSSQVSREFIEQTEQAFKYFCERTFEDHTFVALLIDGKYLAREQMVIALGVTDKGVKIPLDFIQTSAENSRSIGQLLKRLKEKKFQFGDGLLVVIDGSKGIRKAVEDVFGKKALVQRCQWHKRENVLSYLNEKHKTLFKIRMQNAYREPDYQKAKMALLETHRDLTKINLNAANSLLEGLEETLTLHKLKMSSIFGRSLGTTNCIENMNSQLTKHTRNVKNWSSSNQRQRWVAAALLEIEPNFKKIHNFKHIHKLQEAVKNQLNKKPLRKISTKK